MAVQGTFYRTETQRLGVTPVSPPQAVDDPVTPLNPPGSNPVHDPVTLGTPANGLSLIGQELSLGLASASATGALSSTDWNKFNSFSLSDGLVIIGGAVQTGNDITYDTVWQVRISDVLYSPLVSTLISFPVTSSGFTRIDLTVLNNSGVISRVAGTEVAVGSPVTAPSVPANSVALQEVTIIDTGISAVTNFALSSFVRFDINNQGLNGTQRSNARTNIGAIGGTIASGQIAFGSGSGTITGSSQLTYDSTNRIIDFNGLNVFPKIQFRASSQTGSVTEIGRETGAAFFIRQISAFPIGFWTTNLLRWSITSAGILQSNGAQTIQSSTGNLTLATAGDNGNIILSPNGSGSVQFSLMRGSSELTQILHVNNDSRVVIGGGLSASVTNGPHLIFEGQNYTGVDLGGNVRLAGRTGKIFSIPNLTTLIGTQTELTGGGRLQVNGTVNCDDPTADRHAVTRGWANSNYVPTSRTLTINGTAFDLSANRSWTVSTVDTNKVSYNTNDSKTASERLQARINIGSTSATPQIITTAGAINDLSTTSNHLVFTGASVVLSGIVSGLDGEEITILNASGSNLELLSQSALSIEANRFASGVIVPNLSIVRIKYRTTTARWVLENVGINDGRYVSKLIDDDKLGNLRFLNASSLPIVRITPNGSEFANVFETVQIDGTVTFWLNRQGQIRQNSVASGGGNSPVVFSHFGTQYFQFRNNLPNSGETTLISAEFSNRAVFVRSANSLLRSFDQTGFTRRDELYLNYSETVGTAGTINDLAINSSTKLLILTGATDLTGVVPVDNTRLLRIEARGASRIIRHESASSTAANRFSIGSNLTINAGEVYQFIYTDSRWRRIL